MADVTGQVPPNAVADALPAADAQTPLADVSSFDAELARLPPFARGLMQVRVPLQVELASQPKSIQEILELGPGSIVKFTKTCDRPLALVIGERTIAEGEVVKVGDKFGLRINRLVK